MLEIVLFVLGLVIGAAINWGFARQSSRELRAEAERLRAETAMVRQAVNVLRRAMEAAGWATINRDEQGNMLGLEFAIRTSGEIAPTGEVARSVHKLMSGEVPPSGDLGLLLIEGSRVPRPDTDPQGEDARPTVQ